MIREEACFNPEWSATVRRGGPTGLKRQEFSDGFRYPRGAAAEPHALNALTPNQAASQALGLNGAKPVPFGRVAGL